MLIRTDDEMYRVDRTYLGPKGRRFPFRATYRAYGIWLVIVVVMAFGSLRLGIPVSLASVLLILTAAVWITIKVGVHLDYDRPLRAMVWVVWHEVTAPREPRAEPREQVVAVRARRWRAGAVPPVRWWSRLRPVVRRRGKATNPEPVVIPAALSQPSKTRPGAAGSRSELAYAREEVSA